MSMRGNGTSSTTPRTSRQMRANNPSISVNTSSSVQNDISRSSCVNSSARSARRSSSRRQRALWRRLDEQRGLYFDKLKLVHVRVDDLVDAVAKLEDALHPRPAQVEIAVLETRGLVRERTVLLDQERGRLGDGDHLELRGRNLHLARCQFRVLRSRGPAADHALDADDVLRAKVGGGAVSIRCGRRVEYDLHLAPPVAQVDEDQAAHVAPARDPAVELDLLARIRRAQRAAVRSRETAHASRSGSWSHEA